VTLASAQVPADGKSSNRTRGKGERGG